MPCDLTNQSPQGACYQHDDADRRYCRLIAKVSGAAGRIARHVLAFEILTCIGLARFEVILGVIAENLFVAASSKRLHFKAHCGWYYDGHVDTDCHIRLAVLYLLVLFTIIPTSGTDTVETLQAVR